MGSTSGGPDPSAALSASAGQEGPCYARGSQEGVTGKVLHIFFADKAKGRELTRTRPKVKRVSLDAGS